MMSGTKLRFRQIHLDFHTSPDIEGVASEFDPELFAKTLEEARVNSVTCFARCHHGLIYYDSVLHPERVHPHLVRRNLLQEQIDACHRRGIRVPIYITVQWDHYSAMEHPEWLSVSEDGAILAGPEEIIQKPFNPGFYHVLCLNSPYRDFLFAHTGEVLERFHPVDGLFFDILFPVSCACNHCKRAMLERGMNPHLDADRMKFSQMTINEFKREMSAFVRSRNPEATIFYNRGHIGTPHREVKDAYSHFELESLPSGHWGYLHFPATVRYARRLGLDCLAQTGKFHTMWGDFHSFKNKAALEFETFNMLALGAKCMIGDQLEPKGKLSQPVYDLIGAVYKEVERKEPWCIDADPIVEIGVFTPEEFMGAGGGELPEALRGAVRMLQESAHQFDVIDSASDLSKYRVVILPDNIPVDESFAGKLEAYAKTGGGIIASFESGMNAEKTEYRLPGVEIRLLAEQTKDIYGELVRGKHYRRFDYADYVLPSGEIGKGLPETEHVMYSKGVEVTAGAGTEVLAKTVKPYFNRTYRQFCSHRQAPSSGEFGSDAILRGGNTIFFAHPVFSQYNRNAPRWCKQLVNNALEMLLGKAMITHDGPSTLLVTLNRQHHEKRSVLHLLHYIPERRSVDIDIIEDVIPLYNVSFSIEARGAVRRVACVPDGAELPFEVRDGRVNFSVPKISGHQMVVIE